MAVMEKLSVELPKYLVDRIRYQADRHGITGSEMISRLCNMGLATLDIESALGYLEYLARKTAKVKKGQGQGG